MVILLPSPELQFCDANGLPYAGGTIDTYVTGTTTPKTTWQDPDGSAANTNPVVLNAAGRCLLYGDGGYRLILRDAAGNLIWDQPTSTVVSAAMVPVVEAPTIADALEELGVDTAIAAAVATETTAREAADTTLQTNIDAEATARAAADTVLQTNIDNAGSGGTAALDAETAARIAADLVLTAAIAAGDVDPPGTVTQTGSDTSDGSGNFNTALPFSFASNVWSFEVSSATLRLSASTVTFSGPPIAIVSGVLIQDAGLADAGAPALSTAFDWTCKGW